MRYVLPVSRPASKDPAVDSFTMLGTDTRALPAGPGPSAGTTPLSTEPAAAAAAGPRQRRKHWIEHTHSLTHIYIEGIWQTPSCKVTYNKYIC